LLTNLNIGTPDLLKVNLHSRDALKKITADDMGKQALKSNLKKVVVTYNKDTAPASNYATGLNFESGTLTINFQPYSNVDDIAPRPDAIQKLLESEL
jgi:hypothetical protein